MKTQYRANKTRTLSIFLNIIENTGICINSKKLMVLSLFIILFSIINAQEYHVDFFNLEGEITAESPLGDDSTFYYNDYEMELAAGDSMKIILFSGEIMPYLLIETPNENQNPDLIEPDDNGRLEYYFAAKSDGLHIFHIICSSEDIGKFTFNVWFVNNDAKKLEKGADLCQTLSFLFEHQKNNYFFLKGEELSYGKWKPKMYFMDIDSCWIVSSYSEFYTVKLYSGNDKQKATDIYTHYSENLKKCMPDEWTEKSESGTYKLFKFIYHKEYIKWAENTDEEPVYLYMEIVDYSTDENPNGLVVVTLEVNKKRE